MGARSVLHSITNKKCLHICQICIDPVMPNSDIFLWNANIKQTRFVSVALAVHQMAQLKSFFPLVSSAEVMTTCGITEAEIETRKVSFVFKSNFWTFFFKWNGSDTWGLQGVSYENIEILRTSGLMLHPGMALPSCVNVNSESAQLKNDPSQVLVGYLPIQSKPRK